MMSARAVLLWAALIAAMVLPIIVALLSPLLAWREPVYIAAGFAGVLGLALMLIQPLLTGGYLPGLAAYRGRRVHRWVGGGLVATVVVHVGGLWITSPPDVVDALLLRSPTPFSVYGVIAMWAVFIVAVVAMLRRRLGLGVRTWRVGHTILAVVIVAGTVAHAMLIEGTMEIISKIALCALVVLATIKAIIDLQVWKMRRAQR